MCSISFAILVGKPYMCVILVSRYSMYRNTSKISCCHLALHTGVRRLCHRKSGNQEI